MKTAQYITTLLTGLFVIVFVIYAYFSFQDYSRIQLATRQINRVSQLAYEYASDNEYKEVCNENDSISSVEGKVSSYQLVFTDEDTFVIEVRCSNVITQATVVATYDLGFNVSKVAGSGINFLVDNPDKSVAKLRLASGNVMADVIINNTGAVAEFLSENDTPFSHNENNSSAFSVCSNHGGTCCIEPNFVGEGKSIPRVTDCSAECYNSCQQRPSLSFFSTFPQANLQDRTIYQRSNQLEVDFSYKIANIDETSTRVILTYGDGTSEISTNSKDILRHSYTCTEATCTYVAQIQAVDNSGVSLAQSEISTYTIVLEP